MTWDDRDIGQVLNALDSIRANQEQQTALLERIAKALESPQQPKPQPANSVPPVDLQAYAESLPRLLMCGHCRSVIPDTERGIADHRLLCLERRMEKCHRCKPLARVNGIVPGYWYVCPEHSK